MTAYAGGLSAILSMGPIPGRASLAYTLAPGVTQALPEYRNILALSPGLSSGSITYVDHTTPASPTEYKGEWPEVANLGDVWFERVHVLLRSYAFGNILTTQEEDIEAYNAYRRTTITWDDFTNNAGVGLSLPDAPSLPEDMPPKSGIQMTLEATVDGVPQFDTTIDFEFNVDTIYIPVSGDRIALLVVEFDGPVREYLQWLTNVHVSINAKEQRISVRRYPRQVFEIALKHEGLSRQIVNTILFDWQSRVFGIPLWHEVTRTTSAASAGAYQVQVPSTSYIDFRVGGYAVIYQDSRTYDVLEVSAVGASTLTFENPLQNSYSARTFVAPMRLGQMEQTIQGSQYPVNLETMKIRVRITDNVVSLSDTSAFNTYNDKVFLDDGNFVKGTSPIGLERRLYVVDSETGTVYQTSQWSTNQRIHHRRFITGTRKRLWEVRRLLHALRGRQVSFYEPTFHEDLTVTQTLGSGSDLMTIDNIGYTRFIRNREFKNLIRVTFTDESTLVRTITDSEVVSGTEERLTLDDTWPAARTVDEILRVEWVELCRLDTDEVIIDHRGIGRAEIDVPVRAGVFE